MSTGGESALGLNKDKAISAGLDERLLSSLSSVLASNPDMGIRSQPRVLGGKKHDGCC